MKLLFAIKHLENMAGGAERVLTQVIAGLKERGHDITLISFDQHQASSFYPLPSGIKWLQLEIGNSAEKSTLAETLWRILTLRKVVRSEQPDVVITFMHSMQVPMSFALLGLGQTLIASEHIVPMHYRRHPLEFSLFTLSGLLCDKITVLSQSILKLYPACLHRRMVPMPNPVALCAGRADTVAATKSGKLILSVGRLDEQKDQLTLIEAFASIKEQYPDWDLKIIGEGHLRPELEAAIKTAGLSSRVSLPGLSNAIASEYEAAQIFVLPSRYESFGLATAEAMSAGLPVIGFADCPGTNELITDQQNGLLVPVDASGARATALARAMKTLIESPDLRLKLGTQAVTDAKRFGTAEVVEMWERLLHSV